MTKRVLIINNDGGPYGVRVKHSSGAVFELPNPGDNVAVHVSASQSFVVEEYDLQGAKPEPPKVVEPDVTSPASIGLFQDKRLPGAWLYSTVQLMDKAHGLNDDQVRRIMLNCGCLENGVWWDADGDAFAAFGRGFEQAGSVHREPVLARRNATARVCDIEQDARGRWSLSKRTVRQMFPVIGEAFAVRARTQADYDECINELIDVRASMSRD